MPASPAAPSPPSTSQAEHAALLRSRPHPLAYLRPLILFALTLYPVPLLRLARTELWLTEKHLVLRQGDRRLRWEYAELDLVRARPGLWGRLLDYGPLTILPREGKRLRVPGLREARLVQMEAEAAIEIAILGRRIAPEQAEETMRF